MKPPVFQYRRPQSLEEALGILRSDGDDVRVLAGGQSLMPMLNFRLTRPTTIMDINRLAELDYIERQGDTLRLGALTRHRRLLEVQTVSDFTPLMSCAARYIGHPAIRNRGTIGGSISHADPAAELPVVLTALEASIVLRSLEGARTISSAEFFVGPLLTSRRPDELVAEIRLPAQKSGAGWGFHELARRQGDFALVSAAAIMTADNTGRVKHVRIALGGIADRPVRAGESERKLLGEALEAKAILAAAQAADVGIEPNVDQHASGEYRRHLAKVLTYRALMDAGSLAAPSRIRRDSLPWS